MDKRTGKEILLLLHQDMQEVKVLCEGMKKDLEHTKSDLVEAKKHIEELQSTDEKIRNQLSFIRGASYIIISIFTVAFTLGYEYIKKMLGV